MMVMEASPGEFYILGSGLTISFARDPDVDSGTAGIESVEEVSRPSGEWKIERRLMETRPIRAAIATRTLISRLSIECGYTLWSGESRHYS